LPREPLNGCVAKDLTDGLRAVTPFRVAVTFVSVCCAQATGDSHRAIATQSAPYTVAAPQRWPCCDGLFPMPPQQMVMARQCSGTHHTNCTQHRPTIIDLHGFSPLFSCFFFAVSDTCIPHVFDSLLSSSNGIAKLRSNSGAGSDALWDCPPELGSMEASCCPFLWFAAASPYAA
jgi:hypothetical protein